MTDKYSHLKQFAATNYIADYIQEHTMTTTDNPAIQTITLKSTTGVWAAGSNYSWATDHKLFRSELDALRHANGQYLHVFFVPDGQSVRDVLKAREAAEKAAEAAAEAQAQADADESSPW